MNVELQTKFQLHVVCYACAGQCVQVLTSYIKVLNIMCMYLSAIFAGGAIQFVTTYTIQVHNEER